MGRWRALSHGARLLWLAVLWAIIAVLRGLFVMHGSFEEAIEAVAICVAALVVAAAVVGLCGFLRSRIRRAVR